MAKKFLTPLGLVGLTSDPASGSEGQLYFNTTDDVVRVYANGAWTELSGAGGEGASVIYSASQPDVTSLNVGTIWVDSDAEATGGGGGGTGLSFWSEDNNGNLIPDSANIQNIGSLQYPVKDIFLSASSIYLGNTQVVSNGSTLIVGNNQLLNSSTASTLYATKTELNNINLNSAITTASAAAYSSASAYTNAQIANINLSSAIQTASAAAVTYLVDSAPGALDTLNELAAALNDDANFSSTVTNSLATKLSISSASTIYAKKNTRWRKTYSFSGNQSFTVTNSGLGAYVVSGVSNPTFNLVKGNTYTFAINASGHPFWIQTVSGGYSSGNVYSTGTTNLGTDNGTITWTVPTNAPDTLYYACQYHSSMQGTINLIDPTKIQGVDDNSNTLLYASGYELFYLNGILLATNEYTTTSSSLITLNEGLSTNDIVDIVIGG